MRYAAIACLLLLLVPATTLAQRKRKDLGVADARGWGLRVMTDLVSTTGGTDGLTYATGTWSAIGIGLHRRRLNRFGGFELGLNLLYKGKDVDLPVVARNPQEGVAVSYLATEGQLLAGPRIGDYLFPRIGLQFGYRIQQEGFRAQYAGQQGAVDVEVNPLYLRVPLGLQLEFPTVWGGVGAGAFYQVQVTNTFQNPSGITNWDGATGNGWRFEVSLRIDN